MSAVTLRTQSHSAFRLQYQLVLTIKCHHKCLTPEILDRLEVVMRDVLSKWRCHLIEFGGEQDHVHLLIEAHPAMNLSNLVGNLKAVSARRIRSEYAEHLSKFFSKPVFWNRAYTIITVGGRTNLETLLRYTQNQGAPAEQPLTDDQP